MADTTTTRQIDWAALVAETEPEVFEDEHEAYRFSGRTFKETDDAGVYNDD